MQSLSSFLNQHFTPLPVEKSKEDNEIHTKNKIKSFAETTDHVHSSNIVRNAHEKKKSSGFSISSFFEAIEISVDSKRKRFNVTENGKNYFKFSKVLNKTFSMLRIKIKIFFPIQQAVHAWYIFDPSGRYRTYWELFIFMMALLCAIFFPIQIGFNLQESANLTFYLDYLLDGIFFVDVMVNFNTAFLDKSTNLFVYDHKKIAARYLRLWFWIDIVSCVPIGSSSYGFIGASRLLRLLKLVKLVKLLRLKSINEKLIENLHIKPSLIALVTFIVEVLFLAHLFACVWSYISLGDRNYTIFPSSSRTWLTEFDFQGTPLVDRYVASLYYVLVTMLTVGYGDIHPTNQSERTFGVMLMITGSLVFGALVSKVGSVQGKFNPEEEAFKDSMNDLQLFLEERDFPSTLKRSVTVWLNLDVIFISNLIC